MPCRLSSKKFTQFWGVRHAAGALCGGPGTEPQICCGVHVLTSVFTSPCGVCFSAGFVPPLPWGKGSGTWLCKVDRDDFLPAHLSLCHDWFLPVTECQVTHSWAESPQLLHRGPQNLTFLLEPPCPLCHGAVILHDNFEKWIVTTPIWQGGLVR